jgi:hypothetical protein
MQLPPPPPVVIVISGPSGVGKDAVIKALQESRPDLHFVITATSRCALYTPSPSFVSIHCLGMGESSEKSYFFYLCNFQDIPGGLLGNGISYLHRHTGSVVGFVQVQFHLACI